MAFDYAQKITGLLMKAEANGTTAEEGETLRQKAYDLMVKHSIDQAAIDAKRAKGEATNEEIVTDVLTFHGIFKDALVQFCHNILVSFRTMSGYVEKNVNLRYYDENAKDVKGHVYTMVGYESDIQQVRMLLVSLQLQAVADLTTWWADDTYAEVVRTTGTPMEKFKTRREFIMSFSTGAASKIKERVRNACGEAGAGTELALVDRGDKVKAWLNENKNLSTSRGRGMQRGNIAASFAGRDAGERANTGEAKIGPKRIAIES